MAISLVIFDLDGTLVNSSIDLGLSVSKAITQNNFTCSENPLDYMKFVGSGTRNLIKGACLEYGVPEDLFEKIHEDFIYIYNRDFLNNTKEYDSMTDVLNELKALGYKLAVLTNKPCDMARTIVNHLFPNIFDYVLGQTSELPIKPNVEVTKFLLNELNTHSSNAVMCGDSRVDFLTAQNANMDCICVDWGFEDIEVLRKLSTNPIAKTTNDIKKIILDIDKK